MIASTTKKPLCPRLYATIAPHLNPQILEKVGTGLLNPHQAIRSQKKLGARTDRPVAPSIQRVAKAEELRTMHAKIKKGKLPSYVFGMSLDRDRRLFAPRIPIPGPQEIKYIDHLIQNANPNDLISNAGDRAPFRVLEWLELLIRNRPLGGDDLEKLEALGQCSQSHQGQRGGLGPWCERRFGLAAAKLQDAGIIKGFSICGEAGLPLATINPAEPKASLHQTLKHTNHEESMAIDAMLKLNSLQDHRYALIQIKAQGTTGNDTQRVFLTFNEQEKDEMQRLNSETSKFFRIQNDSKDKYFLPVQRAVFKIPIAYKRMNKRDRYDKSDIVNTTIAVVDHMIEHNQILVLDRPYENLSFPQKVSALLKQGFLHLDNFPRAQGLPLANAVSSKN